MKTIPWKQLLENSRLIEAQIRIKERDKTYCGPISQVKIMGSSVMFRLTWCAINDESKGCWIVREYASALFLDMETTNIELNDLGVYTLSGPGFITGSILLYPRNHLSPEHVHGLDLKKLPQPQAVQFDGITDEVMVS